MRKICKRNQAEFWIKKVIKNENSKLYVKGKRYYSSFDIWINEKDIL